MTADEAAVVKGLLARGHKQHDIAAYFGVNQGRVAEIAGRLRWAEVDAAGVDRLPPPEELRPGGHAIRCALAALDGAEAAIEEARERLRGLLSEVTA